MKFEDEMAEMFLFWKNFLVIVFIVLLLGVVGIVGLSLLVLSWF